MDAVADKNPNSATPDIEQSYLSQRRFYPWYVVAILLTMNVFSWLDRQIIVMLIDPIRHDLQISEVQVSLLAGSAFAITYCICLFPLGWAADHLSRRLVIFWGVCFWGLATAACGLAKSFGQLFIGRVAVGAGEATIGPSSYSILADVFPPKKLAFASAVMASGVAIGMGSSFIIGGAIAQFVSHGETISFPRIGEVRSWQMAFIVVGLPGPLLAFLMLTIKEPRRLGSIKTAAAGPGTSPHSFLSGLGSQWQFYSCCMGGCAMLSIGFYAVQTWSAPYLSRVFGWSSVYIGSTFGVVIATSTILGFLCGGKIADYFHRRGVKGIHLRIYAFTPLLALPIALGSIACHDAWIFLVGIFFWQILVTGNSPVSITAIQLITPNEFRGRMIALYVVAVTVSGQALGPLFAAVLTEHVFHDDKMVGWSLAVTVAIVYPIAALLLWRGSQYMRHIQHARSSKND